MPDRVFPVLRAALVAAAVIVAVSGLGRAQTGASRFALATIADAKGKAIVDVEADDVVVEEGGAARDILDVRVADYPVAVVVDNGADARADFGSIRAAVARFIERTGPRPLAIVTTAPAPTMLATFEDEPEAIMGRLDAIDAPGDAKGQPLRAAALAATAIRQTGALFSTIVMVTASPVEAGGTAADELLAPIIDSRAVVHIVASDRAVAATAPFLRGLAQQTHGDYTAIYAAPSYQPAIDRLVTRLTTELMIEYLVPVGSRAVDVKIGVRIPGARVRGLGVAPR
jgi:hypothetical protein